MARRMSLDKTTKDVFIRLTRAGDALLRAEVGRHRPFTDDDVGRAQLVTKSLRMLIRHRAAAWETWDAKEQKIWTDAWRATNELNEMLERSFMSSFAPLRVSDITGTERNVK